MKFKIPMTVKQTRRAYPLRYGLSALLIAASGYGFVLALPVFYVPAILGALFFVHSEFKIRSHALEIKQNKITAKHGIFNRNAYSIYYEDIMNMKVSQSLGERILGCGSIFVNNPIGAKHDFHVEKMPNPHRLLRLIEHKEHEFALLRHKKKPLDLIGKK